MHLIRTILRVDPDSRELLQTTSRNLILTAFSIYIAWHFIATLSWPSNFSSRVWTTTLLVFILTAVCLKLLRFHYIAGSMLWLLGAGGLIWHSYIYYGQPEIIFLLIFLPLTAMVTVRRLGTLVIVAAILLSVMLMPLPVGATLMVGYRWAIVLGVVFSTAFGWGLSYYLLSAIDASTYHYRQARKLLEETRQHRGEISRMLKEQNQANYQLERLNYMLQQARVRAEEARSDRDRFILAVSHELRSPLNFILGFSDLMVNSPEIYSPRESWPPSLYEDCKEIFHSSTHLLGLINDILDMGQIEAHQFALIRENTQMEQIVCDVVSMVEVLFEQKGLYLRTEFEENLPPVYADATRLRQVLLNLTNNSLRFTERGGITISVKRDGSDILVAVKDTGSGIALEDQDKVFDEFRQVGQENWRRREGTGLGMSISRRFVELHGGKMWLESELGAGTTCYFTLQAQEHLPVKLLYPQGDEFYRDRSLDWQVRKEQIVLLLTHSPESSQLINQILPAYRVVVTDNSEHAVTLAGELYPMALVVDGPELDPLLPFMKQLPPDMPVLAVPLSERLKEISLPTGVMKYLVKPVSRAALVEAVGGALREVSEEPCSLLVVDDDPAMLRFVTQALRLERGEVSEEYIVFHTAACGEEALEILRKRQIDLVLLDLHLPDMLGWEVLTRAQSENCSAPVILVSAADLPQTLSANGHTAMQVWLNKTPTLDDLRRLIVGIAREEPK